MHMMADSPDVDMAEAPTETSPDPDVNMEDALDPSTIREMDFRELQQACKARGLTAVGKTEVLRQRLQDYLLDPEEAVKQHGTKKAKEKQEKETNQEPTEKKKKKKKKFNWVKSAAREIMLEDLEPNGWLYGQDDLDTKVVFDTYKNQQEEFKDISYSSFKKYFEEATEKAAKRRARSAQEEEWMQHDRTIHPRKTHNHRGEPVFDMDETAKSRLRRDVEKGYHKRLTPTELWHMRSVYRKYNLEIFRHRVYQEIRRDKFLNWLEWKRTEKRRKFAKDNGHEVFTFVRN